LVEDAALFRQHQASQQLLRLPDVQFTAHR
jgi:hypothetical protein